MMGGLFPKSNQKIIFYFASGSASVAASAKRRVSSNDPLQLAFSAHQVLQAADIASQDSFDTEAITEGISLEFFKRI
jgi:hypothetical protein